ncbi:MAG: ATP-binding protein, partial [Trebonia sp.]
MAVPVGRERELQATERMLESSTDRAVLLEGPTGIGKTCLWTAVTHRARERGATVLIARPSNAESGFDFAGLADLLDGVPLDGLPEPMRQALGGAMLLRGNGSGDDAHAVSAGLLETLRLLAKSAPLVIAIDDVPWLDSATALALAFAARRLGVHDTHFLMTARSGQQAHTALRRALDPERVAITALSRDALGRIVHRRLGVRLPRPMINHLHKVTAG